MAMCAIVTIIINYIYDRAVHISVAVDMRTLLDGNNFSSSSNGQVAAHRVTGLFNKIKALVKPDCSASSGLAWPLLKGKDKSTREKCSQNTGHPFFVSWDHA